MMISALRVRLKKKKNMEIFLMETLMDKIRKLDEEMKEMKEIVVLAVEKNEELARNNQKHKEFVTKTIISQEAWLECPVCVQTAEPPIYKCPMDHLICSHCFPRMKGKCPTCRAGLSSNGVIYRLAEEIWRELQIMKEHLMAI